MSPMQSTTDRRTARAGTTTLYAVAGAGDLVVEQLRTVPTRLAALQPAAVRQDVAARVEALQALAGETYGDLALRGKSVVTRIRRQQATQDLVAQATPTARRTKATSDGAAKVG